MSYSLLQSQKNQIYKILEENELDHNEFKWLDVKSGFVNGSISKLTHNTTSFFFKFEFDSRGKHRSDFSPAPDKVRAKQYPGSWGGQLVYVVDWAKSLKRELDAPDLWNLASGTKEITGYEFSQDEDSDFSPEEIQHIKGKLNELSEYIIKTGNLNTEQIAFLNSRVDYLKDASERVSRKDWKIMFIGVLFNIVVGLGLKSGYANEILTFANQLFSEMYHKLLN